MKILKLTTSNFKDVINESVEILKNGGVIVYPTDTCYGIGCDALNEQAIKKVFDLKEREYNKPQNIVVNSIKEINKYAHVSKKAKTFAKRFLPGPFTLVLPKKPIVLDIYSAGLPTVAIRIPNNKYCIAVTKALKAPIISTSANISGQSPAYNIDDVLVQFKDKKIDLIIDAGTLKNTEPSTIVDLIGKRTLILREGPIKKDDLFDVSLHNIVIAVVKNKKGEVLIVQRSNPELGKSEAKLCWTFPSGKVEKYESNEMACIMETFEETGYTIQVEKLLSERKHPEFKVYCYYYLCALKENVAVNNVNDPEINSIKWVKPVVLNDYFTTDFDKTVKEYLGS